MAFRELLLLCACLSTVVGCGRPIRELVEAGKELIPEDKAKAAPCPATPTTRIALIANLHAATPVVTKWDPARPEASSSFIVSGSPATADGHAVDLRLYFVKGAEHSWHWHALATNVGSPQAELGAGSLTFDEQGALRAMETSAALRLPHRDGSLSAPVELFLGTPSGPEADGFDGVTSTSEPSRLESYEQNGATQVDARECSAG